MPLMKTFQCFSAIVFSLQKKMAVNLGFVEMLPYLEIENTESRIKNNITAKTKLTKEK